MKITVELDLPQAVADKARAEGLLRSDVLSSLVERELARIKARENFDLVLKQLRTVSGDELTPEEVQAEIQAVRTGAKSSPANVLKPTEYAKREYGVTATEL